MPQAIQTRRLVLRPLRESDVPDIARLAGDWDVARMTARIPYPYSDDLARAWMENIADDEFVRAVEHQGQLVGAVGYVVNPDGSAEIGYWIGRPWWGNGFATEAASALVRHCFAEAGFKRLTCCHFDDNAASARVIRKLGFMASGRCMTWCDARGGEFPARTYTLNRPMTAVFWRRSA